VHPINRLLFEFHHRRRRERSPWRAWLLVDGNEFPSLNATIDLLLDVLDARLAEGSLQRVPQDRPLLPGTRRRPRPRAPRAGEGVGQAAEQNRELSDPKDRLAEHRFALRVAPLTARFFCLKRGDLKETRDIEVRLTESGDPSDAALVLTLRSDHLLHATPKRQGKPSTSYDGLGRTYSALWIAVFNGEPEGEKSFELAFNMRAPATATTARRSAFGGRPR